MAREDLAESWKIGDRAVVVRSSARDITRANELVTEFAREMGRHPGYRSGINEIVNVFDLDRQELSVVLIRWAGCRSTSSGPAKSLLKFTKRKHAPCGAQNIQLVTPAGYRKYEGPGPGIADTKDGCLTKDATPWLTNTVMTGGNLASGISLRLKSQITFASPEEPWVYCTSIKPDSHSAMRGLKAEFPQYDTVTEIGDPHAFARQLGIDFALNLNKQKDVRIEPLQEFVYRQSNYTTSLWKRRGSIDKLVSVYHGPVRYEDQSGVLETMEDVVDLYGAQRAWFTKGFQFAGQREYRYAVTTPGIPKESKYTIPVSDEIRRLTAETR